MKKQYSKPTMKVVEIAVKHKLLTGSGGIINTLGIDYGGMGDGTQDPS